MFGLIHSFCNEARHNTQNTNGRPSALLPWNNNNNNNRMSNQQHQQQQ